MKVVLGSDHAGCHLKAHLKGTLEKWGHQVEDLGTANPETPVDYPDIAAQVARRVVELGTGARGVLACGSGIGVSIAANKVPGARAAVVNECTSARLSRLHNDANIVCFGERLTGPSIAEDALKAFLETEFEGGRHQKRVDKISALDRK